MRVRQLVQFLVFPKSFNVLNFYSKGNYALRAKLTLQNKTDGTLTQALPILIESRDARKEEDKRARINMTDFYYQSEHFFVTFSEEKIVLNTACLFKVEYTSGQQYSTYFDFQIIYCSARRKLTSETNQPVKINRVVDRRRLYVNSCNSLNKFKRVLFDDSDYFSYSDVLFLSQSFGEKIRLQPYNYSDFVTYDLPTRQKYHHLAFEQWIALSQKVRSDLLRESFTLPVQLFFVKMITQKVIRYRKLCQAYQHYRFRMQAMSNSTLTESPYLGHLQWINVNEIKREASLMEHYQTENLSEIYMHIYQESHEIIRNIKHVWQQLINLIISINFNLMEELSSREIEDERKTKTRWLLAHSEIVHTQTEEKRNHFVSKRDGILKNMDMYEDSDIHHPLLIIENYEPQNCMSKQSLDSDSLVVMVHGYQGSNIDLEKARNFMNIYNPYAHGLLIKTIEETFDHPIELLGEAVAQEIQTHINGSLSTYKRINFIGYSLGGVIAREALKHLQSFKEIMNVFISFASPHAGICDTSNPLVKTGIWILTNFEKNKNLKQLNCQPNQDSQTIALIKLSDCDAISWFKRFVAVSSREDCFVPYESSRLQEAAMGEMTKQICLNIKKKIKRLERVDVWFDNSHQAGTLDKMIGRRSHIEFLENRMFLDSFFAAYGPLL